MEVTKATQNDTGVTERQGGVDYFCVVPEDSNERGLDDIESQRSDRQPINAQHRVRDREMWWSAHDRATKALDESLILLRRQLLHSNEEEIQRFVQIQLLQLRDLRIHARIATQLLHQQFPDAASNSNKHSDSADLGQKIASYKEQVARILPDNWQNIEDSVVNSYKPRIKRILRLQPTARRRTVLQAQVAALEERLASLEAQSNQFKTDATELVRREELEQLAQVHAMEDNVGITYRRIPEEIYPDMPYVTASDLIQTGVTDYQVSSLHNLLAGRNRKAKDTIPSYQIGPTRVITPDGVEALIEHEAELRENPGKTHPPGTKYNRAS